jgi:hypothetical protein
MRVDCGQLDAGAVNRANGVRGCPSALTKRSSRTGAQGAMRYQLAALTIGARFAVADA